MMHMASDAVESFAFLYLSTTAYFSKLFATCFPDLDKGKSYTPLSWDTAGNQPFFFTGMMIYFLPPPFSVINISSVLGVQPRYQKRIPLSHLFSLDSTSGIFRIK